MAFSSVLQMYLGWANSVMCERGILIDGLHELQDGTIFCHLIELLTGVDVRVSNQDDSDGEDQISLNTTVQLVIDYLNGIGVHVKATAASVVCGELKSILDMMWAIILHCTIHTPDQPAGKKTVRNGRKALLQWCRDQLSPDAPLDINKTMVKSFSQTNVLSDLLSVHCTFSNQEADNDDELVTNLTNALLAAEDHLGITKTLLNPADVICGTSDEHALMIYIALLKRKVSTLLMSRTSSLSSLSSNESFAFHFPANCRHEIVEALQKANSFRFIQNRRKSDLRKFLLWLGRTFDIKPRQNGWRQIRWPEDESLVRLETRAIKTARKSSSSSLPESTVSSQSIPISIGSAQESTISAKSAPMSSTSSRSADDSSFVGLSTSSGASMKVHATAAESVSSMHSAPISNTRSGKVAQSSRYSQHGSVSSTQSAPNSTTASEMITQSSQYSQQRSVLSLSQLQEDGNESGVDSSETQSVSFTVNNWPTISSPSPPSSPFAKKSPSGHPSFPSPVSENKSTDFSQKHNHETSQGSKSVYSPNNLPRDPLIGQGRRSSSYKSKHGDVQGQSSSSYGSKHGDEQGQRSPSYGSKHGDVHHSDASTQGSKSDSGQRPGGQSHGSSRKDGERYQNVANTLQGSKSGIGQRLEERQHGGGGDGNTRWQQQDRKITELQKYDGRGQRPIGNGDFLPKGEDELLSLLEAISLESSHLCQELSEYQQRESTLRQELDQSTSTTAAEEHVVSKLVQELEMLRAENQQLFRDSAHARSSNAHDKKTTEKLKTTINRLKNDVDQLNSENFRLNLRLKLLESHNVQNGRGGGDGEEAQRSFQTMKDQEAAAAEIYLMDQFLDLPDGNSSSEELIQHLSSNQQLLGNFSEVNVQLAGKLSELNDKLTKVKVSSRRLEQENRLLRMKAETGKLEADTTASRCHRLEDHLSLAQKKNAKLVQDLQGIVKETATSPEGNKTKTFLRMRQLEEENALLKQRLELADEDRRLLRKELEQYKKNQSSIDVIFSSLSSSQQETVEDKQNVARERVMQGVRGKGEREAGLTNGDLAQPNIDSNVTLDENRNVQVENDMDKIITKDDNDSRFSQKKSAPRASSQAHLRKPSLGDLIVAKATNSPPRDVTVDTGHDTGTEDDTETETATNQSDGSDAEDVPHFDIKNDIDVRDVNVRGEDDDANSQTTEELTSHSYPRHNEINVSQNFDPMPAGSKSTSVNSILTFQKQDSGNSRPVGDIDTESSQYVQSDGMKSSQIFASKGHGESDNPRLARLQQLRTRLGIGKSRQNSSLPATAVRQTGKKDESAPGFEIKSRLGAVASRRKWNKFSSYKENEDDLGSSYLDSSSKHSSLDEAGASTKRSAKSLHEKHEDSHVGPQFGSVSLDEYVQSLKHRVHTLEHETEEFDEFIKLPEQIEKPQRLAQMSPKQEKAKKSPNQSKLKQRDDVGGQEKQAVVKSSRKVESSSEKELKPRQTGGSASVLPLPNRMSGDGMSEGQQDITTDDDGTNKSPNSNSQLKPKVKSPSNTMGAKIMPSQANKMQSVEPEEDMDTAAQLSQSDRSMSSTGDTDKLHLSSNDDSRSYKHELLKEEEQEIANSIIEKYLEKLSVVPQ